MAKLAPWLPPLGPVARQALGAGRIIGYWRNALGVEDLDNLLKEAEPIGSDIPLKRTLRLPDIPKGEPSPYLLLVGHLDSSGRVLLAIPLSTEAVSGKPDNLCFRVPEDVLPRLNDKLLDRPTAISDDAFIGGLEAAEQWARDQAGRKQPLNVQAWLELGFDLLASVSACDPRAEDLTGAPGAMGGRKPLMARLVPFKDSAGSTKFIAGTYDAMLNLPSGLPLPGLMERWSGKASVPLPHLDLDGLLAAADHHVGHMDSADHQKPGARECFPLDPAQREAVLTARRSDIQAVQGPPGTGKTSMMKAVVASAMVAPLLGNDRCPSPPFVLATGATNKAVTNIIGGFGDIAEVFGPSELHARWIRGVRSYGWFSPNKTIAEVCRKAAKGVTLNGAEKELMADWGGFQILVRNKAPQNAPTPRPEYLGSASRLGEDSLEQEEANWKTRFAACGGTPSLALQEATAQLRRIVADLVQKTRENRRTFRGVLPHLTTLRSLRVSLQPNDERAEALVPGIQAEEADTKTQMASWQTEVSTLEEAHRVLSRGGLIGWLVRVIGGRTRAVAALRKAQLKMLDIRRDVDDTAGLASLLLAQAKAELGTMADLLSDAKRRLQKTQAATERWREFQAARDRLQDAGKSLLAGMTVAGGICPGIPQSAIARLSSCLAAEGTLDPRAAFDAFEALMDVGPRVRSFHLAARYWEARYLMWRRAFEVPGRLGFQPFDAELALRAEIEGVLMLAPCVVSTAHLLPSAASAVGRHAWGSADLLIVDEAGQAQPEILSASLAYARRALVVGDPLQLEPVWSETPARDNFLRRACRLKGEPLLIAEGPGAVSAGSAMLLAMRASRHRTVMLSRHYRCLPEIIGWCNREVYKGKMQAMRTPKGDEPLPAVAHISVTGEAEKPRGGSLHNHAEAEAVATWLRTHQATVERWTGKRLGLSVVIVTPYRAHARMLKERIRKSFAGTPGDLEGLIVGTVHRLQGAEAPVVLFSVGATRAASTGFLDEKFNLLNVAVSRAKDSFVVFAHPTILSRIDDKPMGKLAGWVRPHPFVV